MKTNRILILLPIFLAAIFCFSKGVFYFDKFRDSTILGNNIKKGNLIKNITDSILLERKAYEKHQQTRSEQDKKVLNSASINKNIAIKNFLDSVDDTPDNKRIIDRVNNVAKNADADDESFYTLFYDLFETTNSFIISRYLAFKDEALDIDIKHYIISLIRVHERLENINSTKEHILAILLGKENINEVLLKQTINGLRYNDINANFLPDGETKKNIIKDIDRLDNIEISQSYDDICLRLKLKNELTRDEILQIDTFESNRAQLFGNIADALSDELKRLNGNLIIKSLCLSLLMFLISFWLFYAGYKIYVWLNSLKKLNHKMKLIKDEILQTEDKSPQNLIEDFIVLYKELLQKYEQEKKFTEIKDRLLIRLSRKFYQAKSQIFSSVATLKKDENMLKNKLVFENLEKNSQIVALNYSNIKGLLDRKNSDIGLNVKPFNPQILFSNILEAQIPFTQDKRINFLTYLDANINEELEGDTEKIGIIFNLIILAIIIKCDKFINLSVEIRNISNYVIKSGVTNINFKITINQMCFDDKQINALQLNDENELNDEESEFYLKMASFYLDLFESHLDISTIGEVGNEFEFILNLKNIKKLHGFNIDTRLKIGYMPDINTKYNEFFEKTLESMKLKFQNIISTNPNQIKGYDIVFTRQITNKNADVGNIVLLKEPLTPLNVANLIYIQKGKDKNLYEKNTTLLLCDENPLSLEMITHIFNYFDCELVCVKNKKELEQAILLNHFSAIFIDTSLFENNVSRYIKELRLLREEKQILIAMTSNTKNISERELMSPFDDIIKKPFGKNKLKCLLSKFEINLKPKQESPSSQSEETRAINNAINASEEIKNAIKEKDDFRELLKKIKKEPISI